MGRQSDLPVVILYRNLPGDPEKELPGILREFEKHGTIWRANLTNDFCAIRIIEKCQAMGLEISNEAAEKIAAFAGADLQVAGRIVALLDPAIKTANLTEALAAIGRYRP